MLVKAAHNFQQAAASIRCYSHACATSSYVVFGSFPVPKAKKKNDIFSDLDSSKMAREFVQCPFIPHVMPCRIMEYNGFFSFSSNARSMSGSNKVKQDNYSVIAACPLLADPKMLATSCSN